MNVFRIVSFLSLLCLSSAYAEAAESQKIDCGTTEAVVARYLDTVVEIETHVKYTSGLEEGSSGAGFFIDKNGYVLTVAHVVYDDEDRKKDMNLDDESEGAGVGILDLFAKPKSDKTYKYWVVFKGRKYEAKLVGSNRYIDVALLKVDASKIKHAFEPAILGDSSQAKMGELAVAIGSPVGLTNTVTSGVVSGLHRRDEEGLSYVEDYIQTSAAINPGNSGGPLINSQCKVIGLNDAEIPAADGIGFAVPINLAKDSIPRMYKEGKIKCGWLGARVLIKNFPRTGGFSDLQKLHELTGIEDDVVLKKLSELTAEKSAIVTHIASRSAAETAGLRRGDVVLEFNGRAIKEGFDLRLALTKTKVDEKVTMKVIRFEEGRQKTVVIKAKLGDKARLLKKDE